MYYHIEIAGQNICDKSTNIIINPADIPNYEYLKNKTGVYEQYVYNIFKAYCNTGFYRAITLRCKTGGFNGLVCEWFPDSVFFYWNHETCKYFLEQYEPAEYTKQREKEHTEFLKRFPTFAGCI